MSSKFSRCILQYIGFVVDPGFLAPLKYFLVPLLVVGTISSAVSLSPSDHVDTGLLQRQKHCNPVVLLNCQEAVWQELFQQPAASKPSVPFAHFRPKEREKRLLLEYNVLVI
jgi:hypothetical protein